MAVRPRTANRRRAVSIRKGNAVPYWQLFYHFVWATKGREPLLTAEVESFIYNALRTKAAGLGAVVFALNGIADHTHLVASVPPSLALAKFVGQIKAVASVKFNQSGLSKTHFAWQEEYAAFSFDGKRLPYYVAYVEKQKEHHAAGTVFPVLERLGDGGVRMVREDMLPYGSDDAAPDVGEWGGLPGDLPE
jgi:putative transposase